ncbi:hypothetical protein RF11_00423 [Thelohanellus kitauei]|uniref:Uncharacterized protein n=1 Tax=Thelohanellus kitauei TaxID=669202 RepID=A0A0C2JJH4_THEKT|nr:hypothetical protein RF11_00423 [Thelohanellus kitauei]
MLRLESKTKKSWWEIKCQYYDYGAYIEIDRCRLYVLSNTESSFPIANFSIAYTFSIQKNTKCVISYHYINFEIDGNIHKYIKFDVEYISIEFQRYKKTCTFNDERVNVKAYFQKTGYVHPCKIECGKYSTRPQTSGHQDNHKGPETDDPMNSNQFYNKIQSFMEGLKKFLINWKIELGIFILIAVIICAIIYRIKKRPQRSINSENVQLES